MERKLAGVVVLAALVAGIAYAWSERGSGSERGSASAVESAESSSSDAEELVAPIASAPEESAAPGAAPDGAAAELPARREAVSAPSSSRLKQAKVESTLDVTVVSQETGAPLSGVRLSVSFGKEPLAAAEETTALEGALFHDPVTGADGRARFGLKSGHYHLHAAWGAHREAHRSLTLEPLTRDERRELRLELPTANDLRFCGRVLAAESGAPLAEAEVVLLDACERASSSREWVSERNEVWRGRTDASGRFALDAATWKTSVVEVSVSGRVADSVAVDARHAEPGREVVLRLPFSATLVATVLDHERPVVHAFVHLMSRGRVIGRGETNASGVVRIEAVPAGTPCEARVDRAQPERSFLEPRELVDAFELVPGQVLERTWHLPPLCVVRGIAHAPDGSPLADLELRWIRDDRAAEPFYIQDSDRAESLTTDERGMFYIVVPSGRWWIGPAPIASNHDAVPITTPVTIALGQTQAFVDLEVHRGLYVKGVVLAPDGSPVVNASVSAVERGGSDSTDVHGVFRLGPLAPGELELRASCGDFPECAPVATRAGDSGVVLRLERGGTLRVRIVDREGAPLTGEVQLCWREGERSRGWRKLASEGVWRGLAPGSYCVIGRSEGRVGFLGDIHVERGAEVERALVVDERAATLRIRVGDGSPVPPACWIEVLRDGVAIQRLGGGGGQVEVDVPAGPCEVVVREDERGAEQRRAVTAVAGEETEVVFGGR